jgi:hypothetical protein
MAEWWSIEVLHGEFSAFRWQEQHDSALIEAALTNGAVDGTWHAGRWGVVFEICFDNEEWWETFRRLPAVRAALDGVPDPVNGLLVYRGRGGGAGHRVRAMASIPAMASRGQRRADVYVQAGPDRRSAGRGGPGNPRTSQLTAARADVLTMGLCTAMPSTSTAISRRCPRDGARS